jgi:hypothetical protein
VRTESHSGRQRRIELELNSSCATRTATRRLCGAFMRPAPDSAAKAAPAHLNKTAQTHSFVRLARRRRLTESTPRFGTIKETQKSAVRCSGSPVSPGFMHTLESNKSGLKHCALKTLGLFSHPPGVGAAPAARQNLTALRYPRCRGIAS